MGSNMSRWRENLQMYWAQAISLVLFGIALSRYVSIGRWEQHLPSMAWAAFGFDSAVASDEVADWTGRYGWTTDSFWTYPPTWVRVFGFMALVAVNLFGFRN